MSAGRINGNGFADGGATAAGAGVKAEGWLGEFDL